jgi:phage shock protein A
MKSKLQTPLSSLHYRLHPDDAALGAITDTFAQYAAALDALAELSEREGIRSDVVRLQQRSYDRIRSETGLPAQIVLLGIRDFAARRAIDEERDGIPLDEKLYAIKGPATLTLSTIRGRVTVRYDVAGYADGWRGPAPARLVASGAGFEIVVGVDRHEHPSKEKAMMSEKLLSRVGRLVAGFAHAAVDKAERSDPVAVVEEAIREVDRAAEQARNDLGRHTAEQHRLDTRARELDAELSALSEQIGTAIRHGREDLARAGIERQIDIEAQVAALRAAAREAGERIREAQGAMQAIIAARREGEARLLELKRSLSGTGAVASEASRGAGPVSSEDRALRSLERIARATGVPSFGALPQAAQMNALEQLYRDKTVEERLAGLRVKIAD